MENHTDAAADVTKAIDRPPPALTQLDKCVHCGFCLHDCPTYDILREETDSPRGRISLIAAVEEGRISADDRFARHISLCVGCLACESACPAGVEYRHLLEHARTRLGLRGTPLQRKMMQFLFRSLLPFPRRLRIAASMMRFIQRSGLISLVVKSRIVHRFSDELNRLVTMLPEMPPRNFTPPTVVPAYGKRRYRVGLFSGCVMSTIFASSNDNTIKLLRYAGCEVVIPRDQVCCGALSAHYGDPESARAMAARNIKAFDYESLDAIIVNAAGCGATMKKYDALFWHDPVQSETAQRFARKVQDVTEFLDAILPDTVIGSTTPQKVTYQDPCHLVHGQGISQAPRRLINRIDGLELIEMEQADRCCGSAGIYNLVQKEMAETMLTNKMRCIAATGASTVIAPNPGCIIQLRYGANSQRLPVKVEHLVDILATAIKEQK